MPSWIFFSLGAPALYAVSNFFDKFLVEKRIRTLIVLPMLSGAVAFVLGAVIFAVRGFPLLPLPQALAVLAAGATATLALVPYYKAMLLDDPSRIIPLYESRPIFVLILAYIFLGEVLHENQLLAFLLILIGGIILSVEKIDQETFRLRKAVGWVLFASFIFSFPSILFKYVAIQQNFWDSLAYEFMGSGLGVLALLLFQRNRKAATEEGARVGANLWAILITNELIYAAGLVSAFYAVSLASPALVAVLGGTQPFFVLIFGLILSVWFPHVVKEDIRGSTIIQKVVAIAIIFAGVMFL